VIDGDSEMMRV